MFQSFKLIGWIFLGLKIKRNQHRIIYACLNKLFDFDSKLKKIKSNKKYNKKKHNQLIVIIIVVRVEKH